MAKKYQAIENKVHWLTWTIIGVVVVGLIALTIALQPSAKDVFYDSYLVSTQDSTFKDKLPRDNKFELIENLDNKLFTKGLYSLAERENHLTIVFFGDASNAASVAAIANVYARLFGSEQVSPAIKSSALYEALGDANMTLYHYGVNEADYLDLQETLNEKYDDAISTLSIPTVIVFLNGTVVDFETVSETGSAVQLHNFYNRVFENKDVKALLNK